MLSAVLCLRAHHDPDEAVALSKLGESLALLDRLVDGGDDFAAGILVYFAGEIDPDAIAMARKVELEEKF
jgi:hypothetical protein